MDTASSRLVRGTIAGAVATVPMTITMVLAHRLLPRRQRIPLPPRLITEQMVNSGRSERTKLGWTLFNHFGFGALAGAIYSGLGIDKRFPAAAGPAYGVAVWTVSYLGWVPAFRLMEPATKQHAERNVLMVAAHLVWGWTLARTSRSLVGKTTRLAKSDDRHGVIEKVASAHADSHRKDRKHGTG